MFSANYFGFDDDVETKDGERTGDRICAIPFEEMIDMAPAEFSARQKRWKAVVDSEKKPTELVIGEMGDYILSQEFLDKRTEFTEIIQEECESTIKPRTIQNYATLYAVHWKLWTLFDEVWAEMGFSWDGMIAWMKRVHIPFLLQQHKEKEHAKISIRRYTNALLDFMVDWTVLERRKFLKICETAKLKNGEKYCLAFHASSAFRDFQELGGVRLKDLKDHTNGIGGAWGSDTWANLVKDDVDEFGEDEIHSGLEETKSKRAILIPLKVFTSAQIIKICDNTGQNDDYRRFGVDEETPSGVEEVVRNSTQIPGSHPLNLQVSAIQEPADTIEFDTLPPPDESFFTEEEGTTDGIEDVEEIENDDDQSRLNLRRDMRGNKSREIAEVLNGNKTFFVCECGYSSVNKSATSRHKCRNGEAVMFKCQNCAKVCKNPGSLKRHVQLKHRNEGTVNQESVADKIDNESQVEIENPNKCDVCGKILKSKENLSKHKEKIHNKSNGQSRSQITTTSLDSSAQTTVSSQKEFKCLICGKLLKSENNLTNHLNKVHKGQTSQTQKGLTNQTIEKILNMTDKESDNSDNFESTSCDTTNVPEETATAAPVRGQRLRSRRRSLSLYKGKRR